MSTVSATRAGVGNRKAEGWTRPSGYRSRGPAAPTRRVLVEEPLQAVDRLGVEHRVVVQDERIAALGARQDGVVVGAEPAPGVVSEELHAVGHRERLG